MNDPVSGFPAPSSGVRALVLAGGSGTRLWPRSTDARPKPFLSLASDRPLLHDAVRRAEALAGPDGVTVSGRAAHAELIREALPGVREDRLLLEPVRRNTAPAVLLAALIVERESPGAVLAVLPSDQAVADEGAFLAALRAAAGTASRRRGFVTLGIPPTRPETGFGYLKTTPEKDGEALRVERFVEKPSADEAERLLSSGDHLWNAGIFVFRASLLIEEAARLAPDVLEAARRAREAREAGDAEAFASAFASARSISIDYAVMEKASEVWTVPCTCGWSDLGSWEAVFEARGGSDSRNVLDGPAVSVEGCGNLVLAGERPIRLIGLSGVIVVDSPEGILVMKRGASDRLRAVVEETLP